MKISAEYVAVFEFIGTESSEGQDGVPMWVLDAVPCSALDEIADSIQINPNIVMELPPISFLMLTIPGQDQLVRQLQAEERYVRVTVSLISNKNDDEIEIQAFATQANEPRRDLRPFFIKVNSEPPAESHLLTLEKLASFAHISETRDFRAFATKLPRGAENGNAVAIYDVGQGSLSALVDGAEHPLMFFDMGWPLSFFSKSIPKTAKFFNPLAKRSEDEPPAPVVLSHLDWDHWAYVYEKGRARWDKKTCAWTTVPTYRKAALDRLWLMRRPQFRRHNLGGSHIHLVQTLASSTYKAGPVLHFWPEDQRGARVGSVIVFKCAPADRSITKPSFLRNNEGLGVLILGRRSAAKVLLPGDADYPSIPRFAKRRLTGLVAPHHGGVITENSTPNALGHGRMVMSVFPGSYSNMPAQDVEAEARSLGWDIALTSERSKCFRSNKKVKCGNRLIRLNITPMCGCKMVPNACLCVSRPFRDEP